MKNKTKGGSPSDSSPVQEAELLLHLYEARRETDLRRARRWFEEVFEAGSAKEVAVRYPTGSEGDRYIRMVLSYWQMVATIWKQGALSDDLLFPTTSEFQAVWEALEAPIKAMRESDGANAKQFHELQEMTEAYTAWKNSD